MAHTKIEAKRRKPKRIVSPPVTDLQHISNELEALATLMRGVADRMEYFGGFNAEMRQHAHELAGAAQIASVWAKSMKSNNTNNTI